MWNWFYCFFFKHSLECFWICRRHILLVLFCIFHTDSLRPLAHCSVSLSKVHRKSCLSVRKFLKWLLSCLLLTPFQAGRGLVFFPCHLEQGWGHRSQSHSSSDLNSKELSTLLWQYLLCKPVSITFLITITYQRWGNMAIYRSIWHLLSDIPWYTISPSRGNINPEFSVWSA